MALPPLTTILNNAPLIIQGANKLIKMLRESDQENGQPDDISTNSPDDIKEELIKINNRLDDADNANIQQIELIEALAKQNESLANSLQATIKRLGVLSVIAILAIIISLLCLVYIYISV